MSGITDAEKVADLAMLVARLVHQICKHDPTNSTAKQAMDYLRRCELQSSVLRSINAARQQPITPEWCLANGARLSAEWYWFDEGVQLRPIAGGTWLVIVSGRMLDWSAECVGQVEDLRKALRGGAS